MRTLTAGILTCASVLCVTMVAQHPRPPHAVTRRSTAPEPGQHWQSATARFLTSEAGKSQMQAAQAAQSHLLAAAVTAEQAPAAMPCTGPSGVRFNLEPRAGAVPQQNPAADFILNGAGPGADLIVQTANDGRASVATSTWDGSLSGYYVHRAAGGGCGVQFEGGLPTFTFQGSTVTGVGDASVVADTTRGAFFMADLRFGSTAGIGLFRASAANLLNPTNCPSGTHLQAQAAACWMQTPPALINPVAQPFFSSQFNLALDERATGTGAGDVYIVANGFVTSQSSDEVYVTACTNATLQCSPLVFLNTNDITFPYVQVRPDGLITVSYMASGGQLNFVTCTPSGAPKAPICGQPSLVTTVANPLPTNARGELVTPLNGIDNFVLYTYAKHASRRESNGSFTTFLVYDDCKAPYTQPPPPQNFPTQCMDAEVSLVLSSDNGQTWSTPVSVDTAGGHHFFPSITADQSTGTVSVVYYTTETDPFHHLTRVFLNQIARGSTTLGPPQVITQSLAPMDVSPGFQNLNFDDFHLGAIARGTGAAGQSHLYTSFNRTVVNGTYNGKPLPDKNNHIALNTY